MLGSSRRRPTAAIVIAGLSIAVAIGGTATAASRGGHSGNKLIKKHSLSGNRLKNNTVTGKQVKESSLKQVPNAATVNGIRVVNIRKLLPADTSVTTDAFQVGALTFDFDCDKDGEPTLTVNAATGSAIRSTSISTGNGAESTGSSQHDVTSPLEVFSTDDLRGSLTVHAVIPGGAFADFDGIIDDANTLGNLDGCMLEGNVIVR
ncbi:MAG: hypothetical protein JO246_07655 [Frankiaceae bacterium]|nr:hypothetical protein [Frankiaceae bacterium]MBV9870945.1 hypothetical protein [Frankiaceae bacterium]